METIDSSDVLGLMKFVYIAYLGVVFSLLGMYAYSITRPHKVQPRFRVPFYGWIGFLIFAGVGVHVLTFSKIPWVKWDLTRHQAEVDREYDIVVADYSFKLPDEGLEIGKGEMVRFNLESRDYTYGFGLFREDGTMVFQMQVVPGARNDLVWKFDKPGVYSIRSTEYSGPRGGSMIVENSVMVSPAPALASAGTTQS
ncbi:MAG: cytochrome C oxidase subunit II [Candidatus Nitrospinota bacterium M3_3B_026]